MLGCLPRFADSAPIGRESSPYVPRVCALLCSRPHFKRRGKPESSVFPLLCLGLLFRRCSQPLEILLADDVLDSAVVLQSGHCMAYAGLGAHRSFLSLERQDRLQVNFSRRVEFPGALPSGGNLLLCIPHGRIFPVLNQQFLMGTGLCDLPVCHHQNLVCVLDDG